MFRAARPVSTLAVGLVLAGAIVGGARVKADPDPTDQGAPRTEREVSAAPAEAELESDHAPGAAGTEGRGAHGTAQRGWSDGPRRVPTPSGASKLRAEELGLGTRECAARLFREGVDARWASAARGRAPERLLWPVDGGQWGRGFGFVRTGRPDVPHRGVDVAAPVGTVIRAAADGIVAYSDNGVRGYGNVVLLVHANGWMSLYAHTSRTTVQPGYRVQRGERIALVGQTGIARGPHLHFELWHRGRAIDPGALFDGGPPHAQRLATHAAGRGLVSPPAEVAEGERRQEAPLAPHPEDVAEARARQAARDARDAARGPALAGASTGSPTVTSTEAAPLPVFAGVPAIGSLALARLLEAHAAPEVLLRAVPGARFSSLLQPVRDGAVSRSWRGGREPMRIAAAPGAPVRAMADGLVVFAGPMPGRGHSLVVVHRNGWVSSYAHLGTLAVTAGSPVLRGAWLGRTGSTDLQVDLRDGGVPRNPGPLMVAPAPGHGPGDTGP